MRNVFVAVELHFRMAFSTSCLLVFFLRIVLHMPSDTVNHNPVVVLIVCLENGQNIKPSLFCVVL